MTSLIGAPVIDVLHRMLATVPEAIESITLAAVPSRTGLIQQRFALNASSGDAVERGLRLRAQTSLPFWDSVMLSCFGANEEVGQLVRSALYHASSPQAVQTLRLVDCSGPVLRELFGRMQESALALLSSVRTPAGSDGHIPMLDFHLPVSRANEVLACTALRALQAGQGFLIDSGKSYHFIGTRVIDDRSLLRFLARALLLGPVIDRSWIAHQLLEGRCALRVSSRLGADDAPRICAVIMSMGDAMGDDTA